MRRIFQHLRELAREFQRRRVYHAAAVYVVVAMTALGTVDVAAGVFFLGDWLLPFVGILAIVGFPVTLVASWIYEASADGIKEDAPAPRGLRVLFLGVVIVLSGGLGVLTWQFWIQPRMGEASDSIVALSPADVSAGLDPARVAVNVEDHTDQGTLGGLANRLVERLYTRLSEVRGLEMVGRHAVKAAMNLDLPFDSLVELMGRPGSIVEGSAMESRDSIHVTLSLVDAETKTEVDRDYIAWPRGELYSLEDTLVGLLMPSLRAAIGGQLRLTERRSRASSNEAWDLAQTAWNLMVEEFPAVRAVDEEAARRVILRADSLLTDAIRIDRDWADLYVDRGRGRLTLARLGLSAAGTLDRAWIERGLEDADRALARDPRLARALELRGSLRVEAAKALREPQASETRAAALEDFLAAVESDPGAGGVWLMLAELNLSMGNYAEARNAALNARSRDSFLEREAGVLFDLFNAELNLEAFEEAWEACNAGRRASPGNANFLLCRLMLMASDPGWVPDPEAAWGALDTLKREASAGIRTQFGPYAEALVAVALVQAGLQDSARAVLIRAAGEGDPPPAVAYTTAYAELLMGNPSRALDLLTLYIAEFPGDRAQLAQDWYFRPVRDSVRFQELVGASVPGS